MFGIGWTEVVVVFILALLVFGPRRLPEIGRSLGRALGMFKEATRDVRRSMAEMQSEFDAEIREVQKSKNDLTRALLEDQTQHEPIDREHGRPFQPHAEGEPDTGDEPNSGPPPPPSGASPAG
jgi:TatA/E family protein of Tat protein translocase